ncbi:MAG: ATP-binding protein, partial [Pseudomonadota bacterium]
SNPRTVFSVFERYSEFELFHQEHFVIGPKRRDIRLDLAVDPLPDPDRLRVDYRFSKSGAEETQYTASLGEELTFLDLVPGEYQFHAQLMSFTGAEMAAIDLTIEVRPYWWERRSVQLIGVLFIIIALVSLAMVARSLTIQRRYELIKYERKRLANDLHDTFLQDVFGARMLGQSLGADQAGHDHKQKVDRIIKLLDSATASARKSVSDLNTMSDVPELCQAIRAIKPPTYHGSGSRIIIEQTGTPWRVRLQRRFFVSRIVREAVNNACKHAQGTVIKVTVTWKFYGVSIQVIDNGKGFDTSSEQHEPGFGLDSMMCMAAAAKVTLQINSQHGRGTEVLVAVPRFFFFFTYIACLSCWWQNRSRRFRIAHR